MDQYLCREDTYALFRLGHNITSTNGIKEGRSNVDSEPGLSMVQVVQVKVYDFDPDFIICVCVCVLMPM